MMSLYGQVSKLTGQKQRVVFAIKTSIAVFLVFCCRYVDSFILKRAVKTCHRGLIR